MRAVRYVSWLHRHSLMVLIASGLLVAGSVYLAAFHLPLQSDFAALLPADAPAVKAAEKLAARTPARDRMLMIIKSTDSATRSAAAQLASDGLAKIDRALVEHVESEDTSLRDFVQSHQGLYIPLADLERVRGALATEIEAAKLRANPLYISLEDEPAKAPNTELDELRAKQKSALAALDKQKYISADGRMQVFVINTAFRATDVERDHTLMTQLEALRGKITSIQPAVTIGFAGGPAVSVAEHRALSHGIVLSSLITAVLVSLVLWLHLRSLRLLLLLALNIVVGTALSFGAASLTVGHLNAATAFLGAIIAGNGINYGILMIARYLEERRRHQVDQALARAIVGTLRPTAVAALGAAIADGSLAAPSLKGVADIAVIGAVGMLLCWIATYTLLPALMLRFGRKTRIYNGDPLVGTTLVRVLGFRRSKVVVAVAACLGVAAGVVVYRYVAADPFEYNIKHLSSQGKDAVEARQWMKVSDEHFGRGYAGRTFIAADRLDQVPMIVDALHRVDRGKPADQHTIGSIESIVDIDGVSLLPADQQKRIAVLAQIRDLLDDDAVSALDDKERKEIEELKPPAHLEPITRENLPRALKEQFSEKDGRIGFLISIRPSTALDEWNGHHLIRFANAVRQLDLADGEQVTTSGASVIFADIITSIEHDGPVVTAIAAIALIVMVLLLVGRNRRAGAVLLATFAGSLFMVAACAILGLKVNFLDFVALPITLGLGIDYAINVAHRHDHEDIPDPITTLRTSGSAVFVCSLTTMIGYGSLLVSDNLAIRGFGVASLIGEITCVLSALVLVPALLALGRRRPEPAAEPASSAAA
jgi:predicted RND superfamily exporter protein